MKNIFLTSCYHLQAPKEWRVLLFVNRVCRIFSMLMSTAVCILTGAPLLLPFLPLEKQAGARTLLDASLVVPLQLVTGAVLLLGWMSARRWLAPELLPVALWLLYGCLSLEKITLGFKFNQQLQAIIQVRLNTKQASNFFSES